MLDNLFLFSSLLYLKTVKKKEKKNDIFLDLAYMDTVTPFMSQFFFSRY